MYKEALRTGFFELQLARDRYRELCFDGMHPTLVYEFIRVQSLLLAPICPHICEYIWSTLLKFVIESKRVFQILFFLLISFKPESIMRSKWPVAGPIDESLLTSAIYLDNCASDFRNRKTNVLTAQKVLLTQFYFYF